MNSGLTLPELFVVLAVLATAAFWVVPQWGAVTTELRAWTWQRELAGAFTRARAHAYGLGTAVTVCGGTPEDGCAATGWSDGWLVFVDQHGEKACQGAALSGVCDGHGGALLEVGRGVAAPLAVFGNYFVRNGVHYAPGQWRLAGGTFRLCQGGRTLARVVIASTGRVRRADGDGACDD